MRLSDIREEALISHIAQKYELPVSAPGLAIGLGDDAAALSPDEQGMLTLVTTDMLTEGVDFKLDLITPYLLGWKSVAVNISDIAAMGGLPTFTFISVGFRSETDLSFVEEFYRGAAECAAKYGSVIAGGDTNSVLGDYVISITQLGKVETDRMARRSTARVGDRILVTGHLGDSVGGLSMLLRDGLDSAMQAYPSLVDAHLKPSPRVGEGRAAASSGALTAMMDLSDGLGTDLAKLCSASGLGALVYIDELPVSEDLKRVAEYLGKSAANMAAGGGEDFELLMTVGPEDVQTIKQAVLTATGLQVTEIGQITRERSVDLVMPDGTRKPLTGGWEHFS